MVYEVTRAKSRPTNTASLWKKVTDMYGKTCVYCGDLPATCIDHVLPFSYYPTNYVYNLRPSCSWCNLIASDKVFESFELKRAYIIQTFNRRKIYAKQRTVCTECGLPYQRPLHSPSFFLCAECYDLDCDTKRANSVHWQKWLELLKLAKIEPIPVENRTYRR